MNRRDAKLIAIKITNEQLRNMLNAAQEGISDWTQRSRVNKGLSLGYSWNILAAEFDVQRTYHNLHKINMIWDFGDFLPKGLKIPKKPKRGLNKPHHQEPNFKN